MVNIAINTLITAICLTITASSFYCPRPVKRKQALLESNLPGITGNKMSWTNGAWPMSYAPAHHFGSCLKKLKKQSAILGYYRDQGPGRLVTATLKPETWIPPC